MATTIKCKKCKKNIENDWVSCPYCGAAKESTTGTESGNPSTPQTAVDVSAPPNIPPDLDARQVTKEKYSREYKIITWLPIVLLFVCWPIDVFVIIYSVVRKNTIRIKIAELGLDVEAWERPLRVPALVPIAGASIGLALGFYASYLFKPESIFGTPDLSTWVNQGLANQETAPTIVICSVIGMVIGAVVGVFLGKIDLSKL